MRLPPRAILAILGLLIALGCRPRYLASRIGCLPERPLLEPRSTLQDFIPQDGQAELEARRLAIRMGEVPLEARPVREGPAVVLIVLDTFRADRLAAWGGDPSLAPNLNAFADSARVYTNMRATGTWTLPSHGSLFTGLYPMEHGARGSRRDVVARAYGLSTEPDTLAERLTQAGWLAVGIAANQAFLDSSWGLSRGFDVWMCEDLQARDGLSYPQADRVSLLAAGAARYHRARAEPGAGHPLFLFVNYMDAHAPWIPRKGYTAHPERIDPVLLPAGGQWASKGRWQTSRRAVLARDRPASPEEIATWSEAYDSELRFLDAQLGRLLDGLAEAGVGEDDYVVLLSDHGEYLGEHALLEHSKDVYEQVLRVPLMIRGPGFEPGIDLAGIQTHDVPNLLLQALGLATLSDSDLDDVQVSELYWARHRDLNTPGVAQRFDRIRRAFVDGEHKLVLTEESDIEEDEAFDLAADPGERSSVLEEAPWVDALRDRAAEWFVQRKPQDGAGVSLSPDQQARLRALGYLH